jgi:hypothetical protein
LTRNRKTPFILAVLATTVLALTFSTSTAAVASNNYDSVREFGVFGDWDVDAGSQIRPEEFRSVGLSSADLTQLGLVETDDGALKLDSSGSSHSSGPFERPGTVTPQAEPELGVVSSWTSKDDRTVYLRKSPYEKIRSKHNLTVAAVKRVTTDAELILPEGGPTNFNYYLKVYKVSCNIFGCTAKTFLNVRVLVDYRKTGGTSQTYGVVTAYCEGLVRCPDWVKNAANV